MLIQTSPHRLVLLIALVAGLSFTPSRVQAQETAEATPGARYKAGAIHRFFYGSQYRELWATAVKVPLLDLETSGGGLTPTGTGGGKQTLSLRFTGADGRPYTFRSLDKSPSEILPPDLRGTYIEKILQDQISASHPTAPLVVPPLLEAVGILHVEPRIVVLPDDPALGEYREEFAGRIGTFEEWPNEGKDGSPGFAGATEVVSTDELEEFMAADPDERPDVHAYLTARLIDLLIGDWDRHRGQFRWARLGSGTPKAFLPIPEDRDQAFADYDGFFLNYARDTAPQLTRFGKKYDGILGMTWNGRDVDRRILPRLQKTEWDSIAVSVQERITDSVIESSVRRLPEAHYQIVGERMTAALKVRRDHLDRIADIFYRHLNTQIDVHNSNQPEIVEATRLPDGWLEVSVFATNGGARAPMPYLHRVLNPDETTEVRFYLHEGGDSLLVRGDGNDQIRIRVISGVADDVVVVTARHKNVKVYDARSTGGVVTEGTKVDRRPHHSAPKGLQLTDTRDWGQHSFGMGQAASAPDFGLVLGYRGIIRRFGFRKEPFASQHTITLAVATADITGRGQYKGEFRRENSGVYFTVEALASGMESVRFFGYGNQTVALGESDFYRTAQTQFLLEPALHLPLWTKSELELAAFGKFYNTRGDPGEFLEIEQPYGSDQFAMVGARAGLDWDTRDFKANATKGVLVQLGGTFYPEALDLERGAFAEFHGQAGGMVTPFKPVTLAVRVGGKHVTAKVDSIPFQEAAYVGGYNTVRGFNQQRFAGNSSLYGNFELRLKILRYNLLLPGDFGLFGVLDSGRVWLTGETSDVWHTGVGGGVWIAPRNRKNSFTMAVVGSDESTFFYLRAGFVF